MRDLGQIIGFVLTLWFFLTPICYPENKLPPAAARPADEESDLRSGARLPRRFSWTIRRPHSARVWKLWLVGSVVFLLGHAWFYKLRKSFPDLL